MAIGASPSDDVRRSVVGMVLTREPLLVLGWGEVAEGGVPTPGVIPALDVLEDGGAGLGTGGEVRAKVLVGSVLVHRWPATFAIRAY